ncbi:raffinose synthase or seed imbibition protein Sip1-domain-containing protein [Hyaloraphidium curvatum]|nr:raffinose synthase or seed imbibition protein Sip1-domain-containing protein [Hyaloraphidium curvatum]
MEPLFHVQPPLNTTTLAHLNEPLTVLVQLVFLDGRAPERVTRVELWSNLPRGYEWSALELAELSNVEVSGLPDGAAVFSYRGTVAPPKIGFHEFTVRAFYYDRGRDDVWWAGTFQKNGKVFVTDAEPKASLKSTDVLLGIDPAWFVHDDLPPAPGRPSSRGSAASPPPPEALPASPTDSKLSTGRRGGVVVLSGYLQFPVETAYWARIFPVGLVNCLGLIRRSVWWLEPNTYLGSEKPTVFFLFERSDHMFVLLIPLTMNGVSAAILPQKDASVGVQITLEQNNDGQARIYVLVGAGKPHQLVHKAMARIRRLLNGQEPPSEPIVPMEMRAGDRAPAWFDRLGMCTWNMFYKNPTHEGISRALDIMVHQLKIPVGFLVLDDGWQRTTQLERLTSFEPDKNKFEKGLGIFIRDVKQTFNVEHVGIWFPLQGYWNGVEPDSELGRTYQLRQIVSRGNVWLVEAKDVRRFFADLRNYLVGEGVDFYKVDNQASFDLYVGEGSFDSLPLWKHYQDAIRDTFSSNLVLSMAQSPNIIYNTLIHARDESVPRAVARNSDDFFPERLDMHAGHVYTNAVNNLWTSTFGVGIPDWDMFQSDGPYGGFHAASRALNNGPVYLADEPNTHDPSVVRPLFVGGVAGSEHRVLRPAFPALPSIDSIFSDSRDIRKALKICNQSPFGGSASRLRDPACYVAGLFNCTTFSLCDTVSVEEVVASVGWRASFARDDTSSSDREAAVKDPDDDDGSYAAYIFHRRVVRKLDRRQDLSVFLRPAGFEIVTFAPLLVFDLPSGPARSPGTESAAESDVVLGAEVDAPAVVAGSAEVVPEQANPVDQTSREPLPSPGPKTLEIACVGLMDKFNGSVALSAVDVLNEEGNGDTPIGYRATLWARGRTAFYVAGPEDPTSVLRLKVDGEDIPGHLVSWESNLLMVDARLDGNEVVMPVILDVIWG